MRRAWISIIAGSVGAVLLALAGCGRGFFDQAQRAPWRHEAEVACLKSGAVTVGVTRMEPIEGPGACGMDFPLKVSALAEPSPAMSYADELRPPASIPNAPSGMPQWPPSEPRYAPPPQIAPVEAEPVPGQHMHWVTGPPGVDLDRRPADAPAGEPMSIDAPGTAPALPPPTRVPSSTYQYRPPNAAYERPAPAKPSDIPPDAMIPPGGSAAVPGPNGQHAYNAPDYAPPQRPLPQLGPMRGPYSPANIAPAELKPSATLACPIVSALDRWVSEGVQPAALHWFGQPVTVIHQIGSYSCRDMVGAAGNHISEHAFGNALDISGFTLATGQTITVKDGWHGTPEEQGFLHDVQLYACQTFVTVLAPGYNIYHYNHIHVDLMHRASGRHPCEPAAIPGNVAAARARAQYANRHRGPAYTGSIGTQAGHAPTAVPGADGYVAAGDDDVTGSIGPSHVHPGNGGDFSSANGKVPWPKPPSDGFRYRPDFNVTQGD
jgi:hypothetical protein